MLSASWLLASCRFSVGSSPNEKSRSTTTSGRALSCASVTYSARLDGSQILRIRPGRTATIDPKITSDEHKLWCKTASEFIVPFLPYDRVSFKSLTFIVGGNLTFFFFPLTCLQKTLANSDGSSWNMLRIHEEQQGARSFRLSCNILLTIDYRKFAS